MITLFKNNIVINKEKNTPDYNFINGDYFSNENNWIELFIKEKPICILIKNEIEYMKFSIKYYKTILENISEKESYILYCLSLCKENIKPLEYNKFNEYYGEEKYILSEKIKYKIYPELPLEFFISTILSGNNNEYVNQKIKNIFNEYLNIFYSRAKKMRYRNIPLTKKYTANDYNNLFNDIEIELNHDLTDDEIKKTISNEDSFKFIIESIHTSLKNNDYTFPFRCDMNFLKNHTYGNPLIYELNDFDIYNMFVIHYIYELFFEEKTDILKRISLTWI